MEGSILYSFRRCPYAIRARLALAISETQYEHREILLKNKPPQMLDVSSKGTVPVFIMADGKVLEESLDIMLWSLGNKDPQGWLRESQSQTQKVSEWIQHNDNEFKASLDKYKYFERHPEKPRDFYLKNCEEFLLDLEEALKKHRYLIDDKVSLADMALRPFIRQFAHSDKEWFFNSKYQKVIDWLNEFLESPLFAQVMKKHPLYEFSAPIES